jgi:hypothetical protein
MFKKMGNLFITALALALLVYSASRSLDFITLTLPADKQVLAWFGLAALDGGLMAWLLAYMNHAKGGWQRAVSLIMIVLDLLGAFAMFTLDTLYNTGQAGLTAALTPTEIETAVLALSGVIAANIGATIAYHLLDPERLREQAEEEAFSRVEDATLKHISKNADGLAAELAPMLALDWIQNTRARYLAALGSGEIPTLIDVTAHDTERKTPVSLRFPWQREKIETPQAVNPSGNGSKAGVYASETVTAGALEKNAHAGSSSNAPQV